MNVHIGQIGKNLGYILSGKSPDGGWLCGIAYALKG